MKNIQVTAEEERLLGAYRATDSECRGEVLRFMVSQAIKATEKSRPRRRQGLQLIVGGRAA